ncbi:MAG TPA: NAD(P)-binding domain-containing protein, partial [Thermoanaerobaculia bacterium]|nr:NAD(P)-binding domain-containing protein [Thermoanaerobaculia bacterium]
MPPAARSLSDLELCLAGSGRVGSSLARWAAAEGALPRAVAYHENPSAAVALASDLGARAVPLDELDSAGADLLLVAVADPALAEVAARLAGRPQARVVLHTSGSRGAEALAPLAAAGCAVGALHPLKA